MTKTYSYDPSKIEQKGSDQMRFELGDIEVQGGEKACALCDEEYQVVIQSSRSWNRAKLRCLRAIVMRFAYEVDYCADKMSMALSDRYPRWQAMYEKMTRSVASSCFSDSNNRLDEQHYFHLGMQDNPYK